MNLIVALLVAVLIFMLVSSLIDKWPGDAQPKQVAHMILIVLAIIWLLQIFWHPFGGYYPLDVR